MPCHEYSSPDGIDALSDRVLHLGARNLVSPVVHERGPHGRRTQLVQRWPPQHLVLAAPNVRRGDANNLAIRCKVQFPHFPTLQ